MKAAWYEKQGAARDVLVVGEMPDPESGPGEVRIRVAASGVNPGDVRHRERAYGAQAGGAGWERGDAVWA
jgi:NADPH2:quinone reductase